LLAHKIKDRLLEGDILLSYIVGYPLGRFFIEYFRPDAWMIGPIAAAQLFAIVCVVGAVTLLVVRHARARAAAPMAETAEAVPESEPDSET